MLGRSEAVIVLVGFITVVTAAFAGFMLGYGSGLERLGAASASVSGVSFLALCLELSKGVRRK